MIGEIVHSHFKFLLRRKELILATSHCCNRARNILLHRLSRAIHQIHDVQGWVHFALIVPASGIKNVRERGRERQRVHQGIAIPDIGYSIFNLHFAAMVAGLADEQQDSQTVFRFFLEEADRVANGIQNRGSAISGLQLREIEIDQVLILGELLGQNDLGIELHNRDPGGSQGEQRIEHRLQALHAR